MTFDLCRIEQLKELSKEIIDQLDRGHKLAVAVLHYRQRIGAYHAHDCSFSPSDSFCSCGQASLDKCLAGFHSGN